jgi:hypothetical protein
VKSVFSFSLPLIRGGLRGLLELNGFEYSLKAPLLGGIIEFTDCRQKKTGEAIKPLPFSSTFFI